MRVLWLHSTVSVPRLRLPCTGTGALLHSSLLLLWSAASYISSLTLISPLITSSPSAHLAATLNLLSSHSCEIVQLFRWLAQKLPTIPSIIAQLSYNNNSKVIRQNIDRDTGIRRGEAWNLQTSITIIWPLTSLRSSHDRPLDTQSTQGWVFFQMIRGKK